MAAPAETAVPLERIAVNRKAVATIAVVGNPNAGKSSLARIGAGVAHHVESPRLLVAQRDRGTVDPNLERVASERPAHEHDLGPFDEAEHHQPLDGGICGFDRFDKGAIAGLEISKCQTSTPRPRRK